METTPKNHETVREPRISINKLADYLQTSSVTKRRKILYDQKFPQKSEFKTTWYDEAKRPIKKCLLGTELKTASVSKMIDKLQRELIELRATFPELPSEAAKLKNKIQKKESCLEALTTFLDNIDLLDKYKLHSFSANNTTGFVEINGVKISVEPDAVITGIIRKKEFTGALKLYFSKINKLDKEMAKTISSIVYHYLKSFFENANSQHCFVFDVMNSAIYSASASYTKKIKEVETACDEIRIIWPAIELKD
jgi:hypothetical protein